MAEEKVGFGFEFGIKGDKEVKKTLVDLFQTMSSGGNAVEKSALGIGKLAGLVELGKWATPVAAAAAALFEFGKSSLAAGDSLRLLRTQLTHLQKVDVTALSDSDLASNMTGLEGQWAQLGLDAGNAFQLSFSERFGKGFKAKLVDYTALFSNLFLGTKIPSYESTSPEAERNLSQFYLDQSTSIKRTRNLQDYTTSNNNADISQLAGINEVLGRNYIPPDEMNKWLDSKPNVPGAMGPKQLAAWMKTLPSGVLPESYQGQQRIRELSEQSDTEKGTAIAPRLAFLLKNLAATQAAGPQYAPGSNSIVDRAKYTADIAAGTKEIQELTKQQVVLENDKLSIKMEQRQADREFVRNQNYGHYRELGLGGRGMFDSPRAAGHGMNAISEAIMGNRNRVSGDLFGVGGINSHNALGGIMLKQVDALGDINKNIGKLGIPTIRN
jgi:hypothetical protein